jgi:hypothetical protein
MIYYLKKFISYNSKIIEYMKKNEDPWQGKFNNNCFSNKLEKR